MEKFIKKVSALFLGILFIAKTIEEVAELSERVELKVWDEGTSTFVSGEIRVGDVLVSSVENAVNSSSRIPVRLLRVKGNQLQGWVLSNPVEVLDINLYVLPLQAVGSADLTLKFVRNRQGLGLYPELKYPMNQLTVEAMGSANIKGGVFVLNDRDKTISSVEDMRTALSMPSRRENQITRFFMGTGELVLPEIVKNASQKNTGAGNNTKSSTEKPKSEIDLLREKLLALDAEMFNVPEVATNNAEVNDEVNTEVATEVTDVTTPEVTAEMTTEVTAETPQLTAAQKRALEKAAKTVEDAGQENA